ncbi:MAG: hypothetical protein Q4C98_05045 [Capnocytophaga sp.]|nr:hypothetical protein [Capnocytophaga sp.]
MKTRAKRTGETISKKEIPPIVGMTSRKSQDDFNTKNIAKVWNFGDVILFL